MRRSGRAVQVRRRTQVHVLRFGRVPRNGIARFPASAGFSGRLPDLRRNAGGARRIRAAGYKRAHPFRKAQVRRPQRILLDDEGTARLSRYHGHVFCDSVFAGSFRKQHRQRSAQGEVRSEEEDQDSVKFSG